MISLMCKKLPVKLLWMLLKSNLNLKQIKLPCLALLSVTKCRYDDTMNDSGRGGEGGHQDDVAADCCCPGTSMSLKISETWAEQTRPWRYEPSRWWVILLGIVQGSGWNDYSAEELERLQIDDHVLCCCSPSVCGLHAFLWFITWLVLRVEGNKPEA